MTESIISLLKEVPAELLTVIVAALPISELRGAIPIALSMQQPLGKTFFLAILGNMLPIAPLLFALQPVARRLRKFRLWRSFFEWLFDRTEKKARLVQRYGSLGLMLFVAVPLPVTGAWTGCVAATLFKIRFSRAFAAISMGIIIAGFIVTALYVGVKEFIQNLLWVQ